MPHQKSPVLDLVQIAAMTAVLEAGKFLLNAIANVEVITVLLMVFTVHFGRRKTLCAALLFAGIECLWWGVSVWTVTYFYVWPILVFVTSLIQRKEDTLAYVITAGAFGFLFGMLCALVTLVTAGWQAATAWWAAGIPYDLVHGFSNIVTTLVLFRPLLRALEKIA
jgi:energy-coupling factor transport system substrate-specific component